LPANSIVLDGDVVVPDEAGIPRFGGLERAI
jgi:hypothetical protein